MIVDPLTCRAADLEAAVGWLRQGGIVVFPTDTVYGLGADPGSARAVGDLFAIKGRHTGVAIPVVAHSIEQVQGACGMLDARSARLARAFWPGPLSLIVPAPEWLAPAVHGGRGTVAVRVPDSAVARALAEAFGGLVTATSANRSGDSPVVDPRDLGVLAGDSRLLIVEAGRGPGGPASTIVDARGREPVLLREGAIAWSRVLESLQG